MRKLIAGLVAGVLLGSTGVALGQSYWKDGGRTYSCSGGPVSVFCKETNWKTKYEVAFWPGTVAVSFGSHVIFSCNRKNTPQGNCTYFLR